MTYPPLPGLLPGSGPITKAYEGRIMRPDGSDYEQPIELATLAYTHIGELSFPSGQVIVSERYDFRSTPPQSHPMPPGVHDFEIVTATSKSEGTRVAFAIVRLSTEPTVSFMSADRVGDEPAAPGTCACVCSDSWAICIGDASLVTAKWALKPRTNVTVDALLKEKGATIWKPEPKEPAVVVCNSGMGSGAYAVMWGRDAKKRLTCLVVDFEVVEWTMNPIR